MVGFRIERFKIKKVAVEGNWTIIDILRPTIIKINNSNETITKLSIKGGTIQKRGREYKEGRNVTFENQIDNSRIIGKILNQVLAIDNENNNLHLQVEGTDEENIIEWINESFSIIFDRTGQLINPNEDPIKNVNKSEINWGNIYPAIRQYIQANPTEFYLSDGGDGIMYDRDGVGNGLGNRWWCQVVPEGDERNLITVNPHGRTISGTRKILFKNQINRALEFRFFTPEEYEELKNLLPDDRACKISGCYNNHADTLNHHHNEETKVINGRCGYHRRVHRDNNPEVNQSNNFSDLDHKFREKWKIIFADFDKFKQVEGGTRWKVINTKLLSSITTDFGANTFDDDSSFSPLNFLTNEEKRGLIKNMEELIKRANDGGGNNNNENNQGNNPPLKNLSQFRQEVIDLITIALGRPPRPLNTNDLSEFNQNWKEQIKKSDRKEEIENIRNRVLIDIQSKKQAQFNSDRIEKLVQEAENLNDDYIGLSKKIQQIRVFCGQKRYNELKGRIDALEQKLAELSPNYREDSIQEINQALAQKGVKKDDLQSDTKNDLTKMEKGEIKNPTQIQVIKEKVHQEIGQVSAKNELKKLLIDYKNSSDSESKKKFKVEIYKFLSKAKNNEFYQQAYQKYQAQVEQILGTDKEQKKQNPNKFPTVPLVVISCFCLLLIIIPIVVITRIRKKSR